MSENVTRAVRDVLAERAWQQQTPWIDHKIERPGHTDIRSTHVKAAALLIAEIERLDLEEDTKANKSSRPSWICKKCENPDYCIRIQGCDTWEMMK